MARYTFLDRSGDVWQWARKLVQDLNTPRNEPLPVATDDADAQSQGVQLYGLYILGDGTVHQRIV